MADRGPLANAGRDEPVPALDLAGPWHCPPGWNGTSSEGPANCNQDDARNCCVSVTTRN